MKARRKMSKRSSRSMFKRLAKKTASINVLKHPMRGGIRL